MCDNPSRPKPLGSQNLNLTETRAPCQTNTLTQEHGPPDSPAEEEEEDMGVLHDNGVDQDTFPLGSRDDEDEGEDELMKEVDESEESSGLIGCQSPSTPMTDSSFSETGRTRRLKAVHCYVLTVWPLSAPAQKTHVIARFLGKYV